MVKDDHGRIFELLCTLDPSTNSGSDTSGKKVKGTIHWVDAETAVPAEIRLYQNLFTKANPDDVAEGEDFTDFINPQSLVTKEHALLESSLRDAAVGVPYQFMRQGYFVKDPDSSPDKPVFNRIVSLKDGWAKKQKA